MQKGRTEALRRGAQMRDLMRTPADIQQRHAVQPRLRFRAGGIGFAGLANQRIEVAAQTRVVLFRGHTRSPFRGSIGLRRGQPGLRCRPAPGLADQTPLQVRDQPVQNRTVTGHWVRGNLLRQGVAQGLDALVARDHGLMQSMLLALQFLLQVRLLRFQQAQPLNIGAVC